MNYDSDSDEEQQEAQIPHKIRFSDFNEIMEKKAIKSKFHLNSILFCFSHQIL